MTRFIHLHCHSEFSLQDGLLTVDRLVPALSMPAIAITDHNNLFGLVKYYQALQGRKKKLIIGVDLTVVRDAATFTVTVLCQTDIGYHHLIELVSRGYTEGQVQGKPLVQASWLAEKNAGLIILSGAQFSDVGQAILADRASPLVQFWKTHFPDRYYLELQRVGRPDEEEYIRRALLFAAAEQLPVVATNDVRFLTPDEFEAHEARVCIHEGWMLSDPKRPHRYTPQQYLRSEDDMATLFADIPEALENSVTIARRCNVTLQLGQVLLPNFTVPAGETVDSYLSQLSFTGLHSRFSEPSAIYIARLERELGVIRDMGFAGYFLIVADFIRWAKENAIPVGPGRGSGAGSLVAYALRITDLDPITNELLFERFLNPERVSMPDFDIDFCMDNRDRVIDYVTQRYGRESVSQIITFGTMAARAVVRDVGRVLGQGYGFVDSLAKLIPFEIGMTLEKALEQEDLLQTRYTQEDDVKILIDLARTLEGIARNAGKHAGGVVIAPGKLTDNVPVYCEAPGAPIVTQFDKDDVETVGLVKFDFLGLRTLTIIDWAVRTAGNTIDITAIPLNDVATFDLLKACRTTAVFQLESRGMKELVKRLQPDCFEEIVALVALFRPGPLQSGMVDDFIDRKHGRAHASYAHPSLQTILKPTYGIIVYQEQVMQIAQELAGYTLGGADILRRAMGKKKPEEMAKQRAVFVDGAKAKGVEEATAVFVFDLIEKFAGYGFNKSHSAAYALLSYQTAWLKTHVPAAFMSAVLSSDMDNTDKVVIFLDECRQMQLTIVPPDIQSSEYRFTVRDAHTLCFGLGAIKGVGEAAVELILTERAHGKFRDLFDFCARLDGRKVNKRVIEALIYAGAMDSFGVSRASLVATLESAMKAADQHHQEQQAGQQGLFGVAMTQALPYVDAPAWSDTVRLAHEKESLGFYFSGHPLDVYREECRYLTTSRIADVRPMGKKVVKLAGIIMNVKIMPTKRGDRMAFVSLSDATGAIEVAIFSEAFHAFRDHLVKDAMVIIEGEVTVDDYSGGYKMSGSQVSTIVQARERSARALSIVLSEACMQQDGVLTLQTLLTPYQGGACPVEIIYHAAGARATLVLGPEWRVTPMDALLQQLKEHFNEVRMVYE